MQVLDLNEPLLDCIGEEGNAGSIKWQHALVRVQPHMSNITKA